MSRLERRLKQLELGTDAQQLAAGATGTGAGPDNDRTSSGARASTSGRGGVGGVVGAAAGAAGPLLPDLDFQEDGALGAAAWREALQSSLLHARARADQLRQREPADIGEGEPRGVQAGQGRADGLRAAHEVPTTACVCSTAPAHATSADECAPCAFLNPRASPPPAPAHYTPLPPSRRAAGGPGGRA